MPRKRKEHQISLIEGKTVSFSGGKRSRTSSVEYSQGSVSDSVCFARIGRSVASVTHARPNKQAQVTHKRNEKVLYVHLYIYIVHI